MVSRMWKELFNLQEQYSDYIHRGSQSTKRKDVDAHAKEIRKAKYDALMEVSDAWQNVWNESEGYGKHMALTDGDILTLHRAQALIDPKDGDIYFDYDHRHFDTLEELVKNYPPEEKVTLYDLNDLVKHLMKTMDFLDEDGNPMKGKAKKMAIIEQLNGCPTVGGKYA